MTALPSKDEQGHFDLSRYAPGLYQIRIDEQGNIVLMEQINETVYVVGQLGQKDDIPQLPETWKGNIPHM
jgi:hypothetical protein